MKRVYMCNVYAMFLESFAEPSNVFKQTLQHNYLVIFLWNGLMIGNGTPETCDTKPGISKVCCRISETLP